MREQRPIISAMHSLAGGERVFAQARYMSATDTMEGIRALVIDKDRQPKWNPAQLEDVTPEMVAGFFVSPWPLHAHPLRDLT